MLNIFAVGPFERFLHDHDAGMLVARIFRSFLLEDWYCLQRCKTTARNDSFSHRRFRRTDRVIEGLLPAFHLRLRWGADSDHGNAARQFRQPLLKFFAVVLGGGICNQLADFRCPAVDRFLISAATDNRGVVLVHNDAFGLAATVLAQNDQSSPSKPGSPDLRVAVDLVLLDVSVSDRSGHFVKNLRQEDFKIYEDKVQQTVSYFSTEESPLTRGLVVDRSGSMSDMRDVYDAAVHMINEGTTEDEMFVMTFSRNIDTVSGLTLDRRVLQNAMFGLHAQGATALWDAVNSGIDYVKRGKHRRKALLVITDGADNKSVLSFKRVLDRVRESDVTIYTVGINAPTGVFAKGSNDRGQLEQLAEITGGYAHFPTDIEKCRETMAEIAREVSEHYTVGYYPTNANYDGVWRKIRVAVAGSGQSRTKYVARTRTGYFGLGSAAEPKESGK